MGHNVSYGIATPELTLNFSRDPLENEINAHPGRYPIRSGSPEGLPHPGNREFPLVSGDIRIGTGLHPVQEDITRVPVFL
jgi:hypothetical protein